MEDKTILKLLAEQKLKAFAVGNMGKRALTKKEIEELRKKEEDKAAAHAFQEFVNTFQETPVNSSKIWVKAGTYDAGARREDTKEKGKLYKPQSRVSGSEHLTSAERAQEYARLLAGDVKPDRLGKKKEKDKKKSNLELFKEELKQIQEEREERHKYKGLVKVPLEPDIDLMVKPEMGSFDNGDPNTTNLYLGNLNPKITEAQLMELFGKYGPLASIKIMWPRSEEEKARGRNCGFVAFMNRKDGERALRNLNGKDVMGYEMKLGWGKCVPIPQHPIYIPPALQELSMPPPASGLPFNAQPIDPDMMRDSDKNDSTLFDKILSQSIVKVTIPTDRNMLCLIHRTIEFVIREGPMFEAVIMNREINNSMFRFLFDNQSPQHIYYRWKLFSMMQGDTAKEWRTDDFRMFEGGSIWRPPPMNIYTQGMPESLIIDEELKEPSKGALSVAQRDRLEELLRNLTPDRMKIAEAMVFAMEHSEAADEICNCILESLSNMSTVIYKKMARLYLISDILHNSTAKINNASYYRRALEVRMVEIFRHAHAAYVNEDNQKAEGFKIRVMKILEAWREWAVYPRELIQRLENIFLGLDTSLTQEDIDEGYRQAQRSEEESDDGVPLEDEGDADAVPFDGAALLKGAIKHGHSNIENPSKFSSGGDTEVSPRDYSINEDADGMPLTPPPPKMSDEDRRAAAGVGTMFVPSRWETVDPEQVEAQAMTTSKWDQLEASSQDDDANDSDSSDGPSNSSQKNSVDLSDLRMTEDRRRKLREVEVKAVQYQDELEAGHRTLKSGWSVAQQVEHYRRKLLRKMDKKLLAEAKDKLKEASPSHERSKRHSAELSSSRSELSKRSRSNTPDVSYSGTSRKHKKKSRSSSHSVSPANDRSVSPTSPVERKVRSRRSRSRTKEDIAPLSPPSPPRIKRSPKSAKRVRLESPVSNHHTRRSTSPSHSSTRYRNSLSPLNTSSSPSRPMRRVRHESPATPPRTNRNNGGGRASNHRRRDSVSPPSGVHKTKHIARTLTPSPPRRSRRARTPSPITDSNTATMVSGGHSSASKRHKHRY